MRRSMIAVAALILPFAAVPAFADLAEGAKAPDFTAQGALAGKPFTINLKKALKKGPVVLYFFPAAFTGGCNAQAHAFAEAMPDFEKAGATVIGMTAGNIDKIVAFSSDTALCSGKFAVAAASAEVIAGYDVQLKRPDGKPTTMTSRTSYVIAPNGKILLTYNNMRPTDHIKLTLEAVQKYRASRKKS